MSRSPTSAAGFGTVLVANRGEIAVRVLRTLRQLGIRSVAVFSDADVKAPHVRAADVAVRLGPAPAAESYLSVERVVEAARSAGAEAVHPGYGFLSENAAFARATAEAGMVFIGPPPGAIEAMGDKIRAKELVAAAGVPVVPGVQRPEMSDDELVEAAEEVGFPLLVKAAAGGGGKGMRVVRAAGELPDALAAARREATSAFGEGALLLERYLDRPRHVEVQVLADEHGLVVHLGERECSLQRRNQKVIEEAPSVALNPRLRARMGAAAVEAAEACGYTGAGTVEFLLAGENTSEEEFFFLEMNTRLQVEHPVTELVAGLDLVEWQVRVAAGEALGFGQSDIRADGHAMEARVYAEDPERDFLPTGGRVLSLSEPGGPHVRVDTGIEVGTEVGSHYDPLLAKVIVWGPDRTAALRRLDRALSEYSLLGVTTNVRFLRRLLADDDVRAGRLDTGLVERKVEARASRPDVEARASRPDVEARASRPDQEALTGGSVPDEVYVGAALARLLSLEPESTAVDPFDLPGGWRIGDPAWTRYRLIAAAGQPVDVDLLGRARAAEVRMGDAPPVRASAQWTGGGLRVQLRGRVHQFAYAQDGPVAWLGREGAAWALTEEERLEAARVEADQAAGPLLAPMPGTVTAVEVAEGDEVAAGQTLLVVEAMKMEHTIVAPTAGIVTELAVQQGARVRMEQRLAVVEPTSSEDQ